jgi:hypothetical protein
VRDRSDWSSDCRHAEHRQCRGKRRTADGGRADCACTCHTEGNVSERQTSWMRARYDAWVAAGKPTASWIKFKPDKPIAVTTEPTSPSAAETVTDTAFSLPAGKLQGWSAEDVAAVSAGMMLLVLALTAMVAHGTRVPELGAREDEATAIAAPATRLLLRHLPVKPGARGDAADIVALTTALVAYVTRVYMVLGDRAREIKANNRNGVYAPAQVPASSANTSPWPNANQVDGMAA